MQVSRDESSRLGLWLRTIIRIVSTKIKTATTRIWEHRAASHSHIIITKSLYVVVIIVYDCHYDHYCYYYYYFHYYSGNQALFSHPKLMLLWLTSCQLGSKPSKVMPKNGDKGQGGCGRSLRGIEDTIFPSFTGNQALFSHPKLMLLWLTSCQLGSKPSKVMPALPTNVTRLILSSQSTITWAMQRTEWSCWWNRSLFQGPQGTHQQASVYPVEPSVKVCWCR